MNKLPIFLAYGSLCLAAAAAAGTVSPMPSATKAAEIAPLAVTSTARANEVDPDFQAYSLRLSQRAEIEAVLAQGRAPVPLLRQAPATKYVRPDLVEPSLATYAPPASSALAAVDPQIARDPAALSATPGGRLAKAKIEEDGYRAVRVVERSPDGKWRALALRGQVEVAIMVDEQGHVSSQ
jgi:hypothetical protein